MPTGDQKYSLPDEAIRKCIKIMDEARVPLEGRMAQIVAYPWETDTEAWARVRRTYYDAQYERIMSDLASVQQDHKPRYTDLWANSPWRTYCRLVEFIFRVEWLAYEAVCSYTDPQGNLHHAYLMSDQWETSPWYAESLMTIARAVRCHACEGST